MNPSQAVKVQEKDRSVEELKKFATSGIEPPFPYEEVGDLATCSEVASEEDTKKLEETELPAYIEAAYKVAVLRDALYASAGGRWVRKHGVSQAIRTTYDGAKQLIDGGVE